MRFQCFEGYYNRCDTCFDFLLVELRLLERWFQDLEAAHEVVVDGHDGAGVVELVAVVRGGEDRDELTLCEELVSVLYYLVRTADQIEVVLSEEFFYNVGTEGEGYSTVVLTPTDEALFRVGPEEIADETSVGHIARSDDLLHLLHLLKLRAEATVTAEDLVVNDARDGQAVERVGKSLPQLDVVSALALIEETIDTVDRRAFVVAAEDEEILRELDLEGKNEADGLQTLFATIDVVSKEEVVRSGREATVLEQTEEIVVLAVNVTADLDRCFELQERRLGHNDFSTLEGEVLHIGLS